MTYEALLAELDTLGDTTLADYQKKIISDTHYPMRCVRMPVLRDLAKRCALEDWQGFLACARFETYEEVLVIGLALAYAKGSFAEKRDPLRRLLPQLDSWAMTDSIVPTLKIKDPDRDVAWEFALECLESDLEYAVRFGIILLMDYFLTPEKVRETARLLVKIRDQRYYVRMAAAWCLAEMAVQNGELVESILKSGALDPTVQNMAIRKMRESYRITPEQKAAASLMKRKESKA